jgi:hypothetical protein
LRNAEAKSRNRPADRAQPAGENAAQHAEPLHQIVVFQYLIAMRSKRGGGATLPAF